MYQIFEILDHYRLLAFLGDPVLDSLDPGDPLPRNAFLLQLAVLTDQDRGTGTGGPAAETAILAALAAPSQGSPARNHLLTREGRCGKGMDKGREAR